MEEQKIYDIKETAQAFYEHQIKTHIQQRQTDGSVFNYNGFILKIYSDMILLQDDKIRDPFPILFSSIVNINPSKIKEVGDGQKTY